MLNTRTDAFLGCSITADGYTYAETTIYSEVQMGYQTVVSAEVLYKSSTQMLMTIK